MPQTTRVETSADFKRVVVEPDYADYKQSPTDLRRAYHLASSLFHLRDWTFNQYAGTPGFPVPTLADYQTFLKTQCSEFGYISDLANSVKHRVLNPTRKQNTQMVGLANTELSVGGFQTGAFQTNAFQVKTQIVTETAPANWVDFESAADAVKAMWDRLFANYNWS
jgi:hypothetical protein